jgi:hypothetical protein
VFSIYLPSSLRYFQAGLNNRYAIKGLLPPPPCLGARLFIIIFGIHCCSTIGRYSLLLINSTASPSKLFLFVMSSLQYPPPVDRDNLGWGPTIMAITWVFQIAALVAVVARLLVRKHKRVSWGWDDYLMLAAVVRVYPKLSQTLLSLGIANINSCFPAGNSASPSGLGHKFLQERHGQTRH